MTVNPMKTATDSLFNRLGRTATYKNSSVRLILSEPDEITEVGFVNAHSEGIGCYHHTAFAALPAFLADIFDGIVQSGIHNLIWSCDLICV